MVDDGPTYGPHPTAGSGIAAVNNGQNAEESGTSRIAHDGPAHLPSWLSSAQERLANGLANRALGPQ